MDRATENLLRSADRLEELRHELADVEAAADAVPDGSEEAALRRRAKEIEAEILGLERAAREEAGVQPDVVDVTAEEVAESRPPATDLVVPPLPPGEERDVAAMLVLDRHDEDQVLSQIEERMDKVLMYDFDGKVDLSVNGVFECVRLLNATGHARIAIAKGTLTVEVEQGDNGPDYVATVAAEDPVSGLLLYASATEPKHMKLRNGNTKVDPFARQKAISKAQRNALKRHVPERLRQAIIAMHKGDAQRVLDVKHGAGATAAAQLPPPVDSPAAKELEGECQRLWTEIRGLPDWRSFMLPGVYNAKLSRARSSEVALEAFRDELLSLRTKLGGEA